MASPPFRVRELPRLVAHSRMPFCISWTALMTTSSWCRCSKKLGHNGPTTRRLALYTMPSIAPLLVMAVSVAGLVFGESETSGLVDGLRSEVNQRRFQHQMAARDLHSDFCSSGSRSTPAKARNWRD